MALIYGIIGIGKIMETKMDHFHDWNHMIFMDFPWFWEIIHVFFSHYFGIIGIIMLIMMINYDESNHWIPLLEYWLWLSMMMMMIFRWLSLDILDIYKS